MTVNELCEAYSKEYSYEKQCNYVLYDFTTLRWQHNLYQFFERLIATDEAKRMLEAAHLDMIFEFGKEQQYGTMNICLTMKASHPLATRAIRNGKSSTCHSAFKFTRKKKPDGTWAWPNCKPYFDERDDRTIEEMVASLISLHRTFVLDNIEKALQALEVYDRIARYAANGWPLVTTADQLSQVVKLVQGMAINGSCILQDYVFDREGKIYHILDDKDVRQKLLDRLRRYEEFKQQVWPSLIVKDEGNDAG